MLTESPTAAHNTVHAHRSLLEWPFGSGERPYAASLSGQPVLLAFDGSAEALAAARVADAIASQHQVRVHVVSIIDATPVPIPFPLDLGIGIAAEGAGGAIHEEREKEVRRRISAALAHAIEWPTTIELGFPADAIAREASRLDSAFVVMGLRRHGRVDRVVRDETALSVMRKAAGPVLGVVAGASGLPRRALVAMDFSPESVHAAVAAAQLMADGGAMTLAYVDSMMEYPPESSEGVIHTLGLDSALIRLERALASKDLRIDRVVLHHTEPGAISHFLLECAEEIGADLLVGGSARHGPVDRMLLGSVSAELVRAGQYSTLIVPPARQ